MAKLMDPLPNNANRSDQTLSDNSNEVSFLTILTQTSAQQHSSLNVLNMHAHTHMLAHTHRLEA